MKDFEEILFCHYVKKVECVLRVSRLEITTHSK